MLSKFPKLIHLAPSRFFAPLRRVGYKILIAAGVGVAVFFVGFGLLVNVNSLAVLLASVGVGLGTLIVSLSLPKWFVAKDQAHQKALEAQLAKTLQERTQLAQELARVNAQQLQLVQVQSVMKLTLLEVDTVLTDFKQEDLGVKDKALGGKASAQYVGVLRKKTKAMLGLDLSKLRVQQVGQELWVDGLHAQYQGTRTEADEWLFRQVQVHEDNVLLPNKIAVLKDSEQLMQASDKHREELSERLKTGVELSAFDHALESLGAQWLKALFAPMGLTLKITSIAPGQGIAFNQFLWSTEQTLSDTKRRLEQASQKPLMLENDA